MPQIRKDHRAKSRTLPVVAVFCLILLAIFSIVQVAHFHQTEAAADHCQLCISMHSAAPVAVAAAAVVLVPVGTPAPVSQSRTLVRYWTPKLFTRPPPTGCDSGFDSDV